METVASLPAPAKRRRRHSPAFKSQVVAECNRGDRSIAEIAFGYGLNPNLVQKWRGGAKQVNAPAFVRLSPPVLKTDDTTVLVEVPISGEPVRLHWPLDRMDECAMFIRALRR